MNWKNELSWISINGEIFAVRACKTHTGTLYEPRHNVFGNTDLAKLEE
jgi:hypothetical protein